MDVAANYLEGLAHGTLPRVGLMNIGAFLVKDYWHPCHRHLY